MHKGIPLWAFWRQTWFRQLLLFESCSATVVINSNMSLAELQVVRQLLLLETLFYLLILDTSEVVMILQDREFVFGTYGRFKSPNFTVNATSRIECSILCSHRRTVCSRFSISTVFMRATGNNGKSLKLFNCELVYGRLEWTTSVDQSWAVYMGKPLNCFLGNSAAPNLI